MRNLVLFITIMSLSSFAYSQGQGDTTQTRPHITLNGGLWVGGNGETNFIGLFGPRIVVPISDGRLRIEPAVNAVPGLIIDGERTRLGLVAGASLTVRRINWRVRPSIGMMFLVNNNQMDPLFGFGLTF